MPRGYNVTRTIDGEKFVGERRLRLKKEAESVAADVRDRGYKARVIVIDRAPYNEDGFKYWVFRSSRMHKRGKRR